MQYYGFLCYFDHMKAPEQELRGIKKSADRLLHAITPNNESHELSYSVATFSQGKEPPKNEDRFVATPNYLSVIDGATANPPIKLEGYTSGEFASNQISHILQSLPPGLYGQELIDTISEQFHKSLLALPKEQADELKAKPFAKPYASFAAATRVGEKIYITQVGDIGFRINGGPVHEDPKTIDGMHATMRIAAMKKAEAEGKSFEEQLVAGEDAIRPSLREQVSRYQNQPRERRLGYGAIDGDHVHDKFVRVFTVDVKDVQTLEMYSDGYFKPALDATIDSWEQAFQEVEAEDPYKLRRYASVKGSIPGVRPTDDRTVLIARFTH